MKKLILPKIIMFTLLVFVAVYTDVYAQQTVGFSINKNLIMQDGEILVSFDSGLSDKEMLGYLVRPRMENGIVHIFNPGTKKWVGGSDPWSEMPQMDSVMKIKISSTGLEKTSLGFTLINPEKNVEIETESKSVWGKRVYQDYIYHVNESLNGNFNETVRDLPGEAEVKVPEVRQMDIGERLVEAIAAIKRKVPMLK